MPTRRILGPADTMAVQEYCRQHRARSMFLASNLCAAPLGSSGHRFSGTYAGAFVDAKLVGIVAHYERGNLVSCAFEHALPLARLAVTSSGRPLATLVGPLPECRLLANALLPTRATRTLDANEQLYELALEQLGTPPLPAAPDLRVRPVQARDLDQVCAWSVDYQVESLGRAREQLESAEATADRRASAERDLADGSTFVLEDLGTKQLLCMTSFNARASGCVQIGGVWTPPKLRGRGHASRVVHGHLSHARARGDTHAVLFTEHDNLAAQRVYRRLGFAQTGEWGLVLLEAPVMPTTGS